MNARRMFPVMLLLITYCITSVVFPVFHSLELQRVKHTSVNRIQKAEKKAFVLLTFSRKDSEELRWEHSREFEYKGHMFDVVSKKESGDSITYYCFADEKENKVKKKWNRLLGKEKDEKNKRPSKAKKGVSTITGIVCEKEEWLSRLIFAIAESGKKVPDKNWYQSHSMSPGIPPPELC